MKVALANSCRFLGGAEFWQVRFAKFLRTEGDDARFFLRPGKFADLVKQEGFSPVEMKMTSDVDIFSLRQFYSALKVFGPEVIIFNDQRDLRLGVLAAGMAKVPLKIQRKGWSYLKGSFRDRFYYNRLDYIACVSEYIEQLFIDKLNMDKSRLFHLPNGVNLERFQNTDGNALRKTLGASDGGVILGMAGRLERQKRQGDLIRAAKILSSRGLKLRVVFAGEGRERPALAQLAKELEMTERVTLLGFVEKIEDFLAGLDLFVFCSEWEGMPNAVAEAMACGRPVIAANIPGVKELIKHEKNGLLYPPADVNALASRIERLVKDKPFASELGRAGRATIEENFNERKIFLGFRQWLMGRLAEKK
jgi:glycosyltransferase involved in cell wall biosynthesis